MLYISPTTIPLSGQSDNRMMLDRSYPGTMYCHCEYEDFCQQYTLNILFSATPSTSRRRKLRDLEVSDISVPLSSDSDVIGSGATILNNNTLNIDVEISGSSDR